LIFELFLTYSIFSIVFLNLLILNVGFALRLNKQLDLYKQYKERNIKEECQLNDHILNQKDKKRYLVAYCVIDAKKYVYDSTSTLRESFKNIIKKKNKLNLQNLTFTLSITYNINISQDILQFSSQKELNLFLKSYKDYYFNDRIFYKIYCNEIQL